MSTNTPFGVRERKEHEIYSPPTTQCGWHLLEIEGVHQNITDALRYAITSVDIKLGTNPEKVSYMNRGRGFNVTMLFDDDLNGVTNNALNQLVKTFPYNVTLRIGTGTEDYVDGVGVPISVINVTNCKLEGLELSLSYANNDVARWILTFHGEEVKRTAN